MTDQPTCGGCGLPIHDGAYICTRCKDKAHKLLGEVRLIAGEASVTIARLDVMGDGGGGPRPDEAEPEARAESALYPTPLLVDLDADEAQQTAMGEFDTWVLNVSMWRGVTLPTARPRTLACRHSTCADARRVRDRLPGPACPPAPPPEHPLEVRARWLQDQVEWLRRRPEAQEAFAGIREACRALQRVVDRAPQRWYAGPCEALTMDGLCAEELYPVAGAKMIRCRCGAEHDLAERRAWLLERIDDTWATAAQCAHALNALGVKANASTIRTWGDRNRLLPHPDSVAGRPRYRLGSVRELVHQAQAEARVRRLRKAVDEAEKAERQRQREAKQRERDEQKEAVAA